MLIRFCLKFIIHIFLLSGLTYNPTYTICQGIMSESTKYENLKNNYVSTVYVVQHIPGTQAGNPKINIIGASQYGRLKFLLPEFSQIIFSPGPLIFKLRKALKDFTTEDYLLLTGDPAIIGVTCSIVSDMTNGKYNLLKLSLIHI